MKIFEPGEIKRMIDNNKSFDPSDIDGLVGWSETADEQCAIQSKDGEHCPGKATYRINKDGRSFSLCVDCLKNYADREHDQLKLQLSENAINRKYGCSHVTIKFAVKMFFIVDTDASIEILDTETFIMQCSRKLVTDHHLEFLHQYVGDHIKGFNISAGYYEGFCIFENTCSYSVDYYGEYDVDEDHSITELSYEPIDEKEFCEVFNLDEGAKIKHCVKDDDEQ